MQYGYFCEDTALEVFIDAVLHKFKKGHLEKNKEFFDKISIAVQGNDATIERQFVDVSKQAQILRLDLFIVAQDYDSKPLADYDNFIRVRKDKLNIKVRNRTVFCIPRKCIEYWLYYVKHQDDANAPEPDSLESNPDFNCAKAKTNVYQGKIENNRYEKQSRETETKHALEILQQLDIEKLRKLSPSFDNFYRQFQAVNL
jgi:hypothetical protein